MNNLELLALAIATAKETSLTDCPNEVVYMYFSQELNEYTNCPERNVEKLLAVEPNLTLIAKFLNGAKVE